jgi:hypothetical protein
VNNPLEQNTMEALEVIQNSLEGITDSYSDPQDVMCMRGSLPERTKQCVFLRLCA